MLAHKAATGTFFKLRLDETGDKTTIFAAKINFKISYNFIAEKCGALKCFIENSNETSSQTLQTQFMKSDKNQTVIGHFA